MVRFDSTFGGDGRVNYGDSGTYFTAVASDNLSTIAVGVHNGNQIVVAKYNRHGRLDQSFSGDGTKFTREGKAQYPTFVSVQPNGSIVVGSSSLDHFTVLRLDPDGHRDSTFGVNGVVTYPFQYALTFQFAVDSHGRIVAVAGSSRERSKKTLRIWRLLDDGSLDDTFAGDGRLTLNVRADFVGGVGVDTSDNIVALARVRKAGGAKVVDVRRIKEDGSAARLLRRLGSPLANLTPGPLAVANDDGIAGLVTDDGGTTVFKLKASGRFDLGFSKNGKLKARCDISCTFPVMDVAQNGAIYVAGSTAETARRNHTVVGKITQSGRWAESFASGGQRAIEPFTRASFVYAMDRDSDGRLLLAGLRDALHRHITGFLVRLNVS